MVQKTILFFETFNEKYHFKKNKKQYEKLKINTNFVIIKKTT